MRIGCQRPEASSSATVTPSKQRCHVREELRQVK